MRISSIVVHLSVVLLFSLTSCSDQPYSFQEPVLRCPDETIVHYGEGTYYWGANGEGSCSFDSSTSDLMIGAMNAFDFSGSQICGACIRVTGPDSTILIRIVDLCPECPRGNIDLSPQAFSKIADTLLGRVPISWELVACATNGSITYRFKDSINYWWTAVQIRNHRYPIYSVQYLTSQNSFQQLPRMSYNYFAGYANMGSNPFTFRVTDIYGHVLIDSGIVPMYNKDIAGTNQFPLCPIHED
ncbi:MAG: hypothetical protein HYV29_07590 [Ignavibacteriales bacterium]|nr:hypothetical protein [Ignavibacteriales bacterium]